VPTLVSRDFAFEILGFSFEYYFVGQTISRKSGTSIRVEEFDLSGPEFLMQLEAMIESGSGGQN
jgi:hypothetical protein